ncbi:MAG: methyltransferase domain-containing protein [Candidatus Aenigmatarchaeota archaeon]
MSITRTVKSIANIIPAWGVWWERFETAKKLVEPAELTLDLGCSEYGGLEKALAKNGKVIGADLKKNIDRKLLNENFFYVVADAQCLPFKSNSFQQTVCLDMIEHVGNDCAAAKEIERIGKSGANIVLSTPSEFWSFPYFRFMKIFCKSEEQTLKEFGHVHKGYSEEQLRKLFSGCNISEKRYFVSGLSALGYDIEFSKLRILENLILKILYPVLWLNFKLSKHKNGTHIAVRMEKL